MKKNMLTYIIIGIITLIGIYFLAKSSNKTKTEITNQPTEIESDQNPYLGMREMAFSGKSDKIGIENIEDDKVYGLITEMAMNPGSASVVSFLTGDASLYLSSGGGFIGAGQHEDVRKMVADKVDGFQKYLSSAEKIDKPELPEIGKVNFNFLTNNGIYSVTEYMTNLESGESDLSDLFIEVNEIIEQIRLKSNR